VAAHCASAITQIEHVDAALDRLQQILGGLPTPIRLARADPQGRLGAVSSIIFSITACGSPTREPRRWHRPWKPIFDEAAGRFPGAAPARRRPWAIAEQQYSLLAPVSKARLERFGPSAATAASPRSISARFRRQPARTRRAAWRCPIPAAAAPRSSARATSSTLQPIDMGTETSRPSRRACAGPPADNHPGSRRNPSASGRFQGREALQGRPRAAMRSAPRSQQSDGRCCRARYRPPGLAHLAASARPSWRRPCRPA